MPSSAGVVYDTDFEGLCRMDMVGREYVPVTTICVTTFALDERELGNPM